MNKRLFMLLLTGLIAAMSFVACNDEEGIDPTSAEPTVAYPYDELVADLNMADNLPIIAVVKSAAGLESVRLTIRTANDELISILAETDFFNAKNYSLSERINYKPGYVEAIVEAVDLLGRKIEQKLPIRIVDVVAVPAIVFTSEEISYDETVSNIMPRTGFTTSTTATLRSVEMFRVKTTGQEDFSKVTFSDEDPQKSFSFDELINYTEFDKGFKVKVVDSYGQVRIATLNVKYKTVPPPVVTFTEALITAAKDEEKAVGASIGSEAGLVKVEMYRITGKTEELVSTITPAKTNTYAYSEKMTFTNATSGVKLVATDNVGRVTTVSTKAVVNLAIEMSIKVGTAPVADGTDGSNRLLSLGGLKTYSLQECFDNTGLQSHIDFKVYYMKGGNPIRIYAMENKNSEYKTADGQQSLNNFSVRNQTRFQILGDSYDFDNATAADIAMIEAASINSADIVTTGNLPVFAFKTGATSSAGAAKIGIAKVVAVSEKIGANENARIFTLAIKFPVSQD